MNFESLSSGRCRFRFLRGDLGRNWPAANPVGFFLGDRFPQLVGSFLTVIQNGV